MGPEILDEMAESLIAAQAEPTAVFCFKHVEDGLDDKMEDGPKLSQADDKVLGNCTEDV